MSRHHSHLNTAKSILENYTGEIPFAVEIKQFFSGQKKYGSKDRRQIRHLCYCYFRAFRAYKPDWSIKDKIICGYFLCTPDETPFLETHKPEWNKLMQLPVLEKCEFLQLNAEHIFPYLNELEDAIDKISFSLAHLTQPDLFLRIRPNHQHSVQNKLDNAEIDYTMVDSNCIALKNTTKIEEVVKVNREVVIQDYASQRVGGMFDLVKAQFPAGINKPKVWDCCAASGGKTILAFDKLGQIEMTVSDIRESILRNLKKRLQQAQIVSFKSKEIDLSDPNALISIENFDLIIADVPCSGSGTWSRTPERLAYFEKSEIDQYSKLQKEITQNIQTKLKPGAFLLYITCSVYRQENSEIANNLVDNFGLKWVHSKVYSGAEFKSDTMYAALLQKPV